MNTSFLREDDSLLSSVIPPMTPRSRPGSRPASPSRGMMGGGGGLRRSQSLGSSLGDAGRGKRATTPMPKQRNRTSGRGSGVDDSFASERGGGGVQADSAAEETVEHGYLVAAAKSIPNEYGTQLASYLVRRPYINDDNMMEGDDDERWSSYPHLSTMDDYQHNSTAYDPSSLEIFAYIEADGSVFTLTGPSNARHGKVVGGGIGGEELDWTVFDDVEEMDRALGRVTYIDVEGNEREYWLGK